MPTRATDSFQVLQIATTVPHTIAGARTGQRQYVHLQYHATERLQNKIMPLCCLPVSDRLTVGRVAEVYVCRGPVASEASGRMSTRVVRATFFWSVGICWTWLEPHRTSVTMSPPTSLPATSCLQVFVVSPALVFTLAHRLKPWAGCASFAPRTRSCTELL